MVGGGSRRDDGSLVINNTNVFAALDTLRKKKKQKEPEPQVIWQPAPLNSKLWADADDDEDDYFATTAPLPSAWGEQEPQKGEESESEEDFLDEGDEEVEEEDHDHEPEVQVHPEPVVKKPLEVSAVPKETDRQLSKKERKKKELAELEALLADFGVTQKDGNQQDETRENAQETKDGEKKENALGESKSAKKKKKKDKASKEVKENQDQPANSVVNYGPVEATGAEHVEEDSSAIDMKEKLKRMASAKKKKSSKENAAAAKAAAQEAAARSAKLAAAKKKEKNHYNQQPVR